ncbi:hypothetical protein P43SY_001888 [Pythium insidiosum]|uniref:VWFA domain-containing protein n=1 Tax=Pythium insidiosum TaxID=114742 RepID=A0AAD5LZV7_PYTIN|nr:hypothetical protein P43SY_001888 [Pythium insidiosum]
MLNLAFLLDITGSMSEELDGVKQTVARLVETAFTDNSDLMVTIITFTEDHKGCYVTTDSFVEGTAAVDFVERIELCVPPGMPHINAHGGDGDENHKAALAALLRLDKGVPTVAFVITDAAPHLQGTSSQEMNQEIRYLSQEHGITNPDLFLLLDDLDAHFDGGLILSVVKYYKNHTQPTYGAVAKRLNGVLITPKVRSPDSLATGLMTIITQLISEPTSDPVAQSSALQDLDAFDFYDLKDIVIPENELGRSAIPMPPVGSTDELLFRLVERTAVIAGDRFKKRAITAHLVTEQVELLHVLAKGMLRAIPVEEAVERATLLLTKIKNLMGEEHKSQFKLTVSQLKAILEDDTFASAGRTWSPERTAAVSAITLMSIEETARDLAEEDDSAPARDPYESLLAVASLFLGHLAVLSLPTRMGRVDFMDAWSAVVSKVSNDVVSAADFLRLIGSDESVAGLSARDREFNFLQLVADPQDALGSQLLRVASGTQILDILTAMLAGAPVGLFSPNMFRGTSAASLMRLLNPDNADDEELSEFQWGLAAKMAHTVRLIMGLRGSALALDLEPESAMGKLLFRLLRRTALDKDAATDDLDESEVRLFLEEMVAARIQKFAKYNEAAYLILVKEMLGYSLGVENAAAVVDVFESHPLLDSDCLPIDEAVAIATIKESTLLRHIEASASNVLRVVFADRDRTPSLQQIWPSYLHDIPKLVLLQRRTERYDLSHVEPDTEEDEKVSVGMKTASWTRNNAMQHELQHDTFSRRAKELMCVKYDAFVREMRARRLDLRREHQRQIVLKLMRAPVDEFAASLASVVQSSSSKEHKLLLQMLSTVGSQELPTDEYEAKVQVLVTGRTVTEDSERIVFNRGNLLAHPDRFVPISEAFQARLRALRQQRGWSLAHKYRDCGPNHSGHSNENPSQWALKRSTAEHTFWEDE